MHTLVMSLLPGSKIETRIFAAVSKNTLKMINSAHLCHESITRVKNGKCFLQVGAFKAYSRVSKAPMQKVFLSFYAPPTFFPLLR